MSSPDPVIAAMRAEHDRLAVLVRTFDDAALAGPSGAAEWDISQVLSHLGSGAEIGRAILLAALGEGTRPEREEVEGIWQTWNDMTRRRRADGFLQAGEALVALYESLDAPTRESLRIEMGFLPAPVEVQVAARLRLSELALHAWDVRAGLDPHPTLPPATAAELLHGEPDMIGWIGRPAEGVRAVIKVTTTEPASVFALRLLDRISVDFDVPDEPDGTLTLPAEAWLRLVAGRLGPSHIPADVVATGVADLGLLRKVFPGY
ncbi:maleylpyruvate isomerase family mycothiol-dependent enzyme [Spongiactinospora rosea]|uniref:Maleylpyruvate isomerase family mycothiol-dependent enzyme n=1 Tax=Spongiactinospora rosea TaxID=2248750 RepID=A0A366M3G4_9ACTN|nr:maleylpyruvate isomerase family mycothiol-dependent enzyme [Spongiactinospora rosea]RBQ20735.1 maleylpyruvate isomerase family mycothiol-dependent enzyme [Spongiactinospora rosea]